MLFTIVQKEFLNNLFSFRFTIAVVLCVLLMLISSYTLREKYEQQLSEYNAAVTTHRKNLDEAANLQNIMLGGYKLDKRPAPLSVLSVGLEGVGKTTTANIASEPAYENSEMSNEPLGGLFGSLDYVFITRIVMSLLALLFTYDAIAGERESGTLKLMLSNAVPRDQVILGKAIGSYLSLLLPFIVSSLIGLAVIVLSPQIRLDVDAWQRILIVFLVSLLYIWVFTMIGLFVSARTERSSTALMSLLLIWVVFVLAVPKASNLIAGQIYKIPSVQDVQAQKTAVEQQIDAELQPKYMEIQNNASQEVVRKWQAEGREFEGHQDELRKEIIAIILERTAELQREGLDRTDNERNKIQAAYDRQVRSQLDLAINLSRISPASSYTFASTSVTNTGISRQREFLQEAKQYQRAFSRYLNTKLAEGKGLGLDPGNPEDKIDLSDMPKFQPTEPTLEKSLSEIWIDIVLLFAMGIIFFMASFVSFLRYDVR
jgi:ABC-type transport system involved in multi-copper enzyme maturation permease subunit